MLTFEGCNFFRQRLVLSTLSGKAVKIVRIRDKDEQPGLTGLYTSSFVHVCHSSRACAFVITIILNNEKYHSTRHCKGAGLVEQALQGIRNFVTNFGKSFLDLSFIVSPLFQLIMPRVWTITCVFILSVLGHDVGVL